MAISKCVRARDEIIKHEKWTFVLSKSNSGIFQYVIMIFDKNEKLRHTFRGDDNNVLHELAINYADNHMVR